MVSAEEVLAVYTSSAGGGARRWDPSLHVPGLSSSDSYLVSLAQ